LASNQNRILGIDFYPGLNGWNSGCRELNI